MNELFEEYGWTCISIVGGFIGMKIVFTIFFGTGSYFSQAIGNIVSGLM